MDITGLMPEIKIEGPLLYGLVAVGVGVLLMVVVLSNFSRLRVWRCPDGEPVPDFWNAIRNSSVSKIVGRGWLFITFLAAGVLLGGCATVRVGVLR